MKIYLILLLGFIYLWFVPVQGQSATGDLESYLNDYLATLPGSSGDDFQQPTPTELTDWHTMVENILAFDITLANIQADAFNYRVLSYTDSVNNPGNLYYILEEKVPATRNWGTFVFNASPCRSTLNLQSPHPKKDFKTGQEAIYCYTRLDAHTLMLAGTNRCNHSVASACDGSTSVCAGTSAPYPISDMAHNAETAFQEATQSVFAHDTQAVFIQFHGFTKQSSDPYVILSNGTRITPASDPIALLEQALYAQDTVLTFKIGHIDLGWSRLLGFSNVQARMLNGSPSPCDTVGPVSRGNFVHIEQEKSRLRDDSTGWDKMYRALADVFDCVVLSTPETIAETQLLIFPNPAQSGVIRVSGPPMQRIRVLDVHGKEHMRLVAEATGNGKSSDSFELKLDGFPAGIYFVIAEGNGQKWQQKLIIQ